jgi:hypothetical protein
MQSALISRRHALINAASVALGSTFASAVSRAYADPVVTSVPAQITSVLSRAQMIGRSRLRAYGLNIYDATLWAEPSFVAENYFRQAFALELQYLRSFKGHSIAERSLQEMQRLGQLGTEKSGQWLAQMKKIFPDVQKADRLMGLHRGNGVVSFFLNNQPVGQVQDEEFVRFFFGIWLKPQTLEPKMRNELLGLSAGAQR